MEQVTHHTGALRNEGDCGALTAWKNQAVACSEFGRRSDFDGTKPKFSEGCDVLPERSLKSKDANGDGHFET